MKHYKIKNENFGKYTKSGEIQSKKRIEIVKGLNEILGKYITILDRSNQKYTE